MLTFTFNKNIHMAKADNKGQSVTVSMRIDSEINEKIKALAYWERKTIKEVAEAAFLDSIAKYEKKNGAIKTPPTK